MSRVPANLLYMTVYNPSLRPDVTLAQQDEDIEEQAHILFYTAKERAVSRDRMLRQVGLAKALINFSQIFNLREACESVHSQSRRMVMVSPEPNFWIHACVETAKTPRAPTDKDKAKEKDKNKPQDKAKTKDLPPVYDHDDASVHDLALRADILRGYEQFKLTHGSFTTILETLGKEALELQLERFFTVWAWSWNLEEPPEFGAYLGVPLHPLHKRVLTILDEYDSDGAAVLIINPPFVIPSSKFTEAGYPSALIQHLVAIALRSLLVSQNQENSLPVSSNDTLRDKRSPEPSSEAPAGQITVSSPSSSATSANTFLMNMDMRKWSWPGYFSFGKASNKRPRQPVAETNRKCATAVEQGVAQPPVTLINEISSEETPEGLQTDLDSGDSPNFPAAEEAFEEQTTAIQPYIVPESQTVISELQDAFEPLSPVLTTSDSLSETQPDAESIDSRAESDADTISKVSTILLHLSKPSDPLRTQRTPIFYMSLPHSAITAAIVHTHASTDDLSEVPIPTDKMESLLHQVRDTVEEELLRSSSEMLPSATKILQPKDRHILSFAGFTTSASEFSSRSGHLFNIKSLQESLNITEVFSRGQNPQHWHIGRRGLGMISDGVNMDGEAYMEVFRKETSLTDVDNALVGVLRKFTE